ncbi:hypothetical protein [Streptomyces bungoensis]
MRGAPALLVQLSSGRVAQPVAAATAPPALSAVPIPCEQGGE